jgi:hypothetical protein
MNKKSSKVTMSQDFGHQKMHSKKYIKIKGFYVAIIKITWFLDKKMGWPHLCNSIETIYYLK